MPFTGGPEAGRGGGGGGRGNAGPPGSGVPGDSFSQPADVTWDRAGNIYVADGYGNNNRIAKFNKDGDFLKSWGQTGSAQGQFNKIRGIASDAQGNLYVADAGNNRIQVFDGEGTFKSQITNIVDAQVEQAWRICTAILDGWRAHPPEPDSFPNYEAGTWGPEEARSFIERDGRGWHRP